MMRYGSTCLMPTRGRAPGEATVAIRYKTRKQRITDGSRSKDLPTTVPKTRFAVIFCSREAIGEFAGHGEQNRSTTSLRRGTTMLRDFSYRDYVSSFEFLDDYNDFHRKYAKTVRDIGDDLR